MSDEKTAEDFKTFDKFIQCEHRKKNEIDPNCIHCNFEWCLMRIIHLEDLVFPEQCICSAIKMADGYLARGHRHCDCIKHIQELYSYLNKKVEWDGAIQGFMTSRNRFVDREEGARLQKEAGIKSVRDDSYVPKTLFSEDLY